MTATPGTIVPFLDLGELEDRDNADLRPTEAVKHPANPVLQPAATPANGTASASATGRATSTGTPASPSSSAGTTPPTWKARLRSATR